MQTKKLEDMVRGWFVGDFTPTVYSTADVEVAVKKYQAGEAEDRHYHKVAVEITVIVSGEAEMNGTKYPAGSIIKLYPGERSDFRAITDTVTTVVKIPCVKNDKYLDEK